VAPHFSLPFLRSKKRRDSGSQGRRWRDKNGVHPTITCASNSFRLAGPLVQSDPVARFVRSTPSASRLPSGLRATRTLPFLHPSAVEARVRRGPPCSRAPRWLRPLSPRVVACAMAAPLASLCALQKCWRNGART